jgi:hypothetical protein
MQCSKSLEIKDNYTNALFAVEIFVNFTRCFQYGALLCEEGLLPLIMSMLETHMTSDMIGKVSEALVNLSTTRKNRREIANCGIGLFLDRVFSLGAPDNRADILSMIGNLLTSGYFHDKIAREETISTMLNQLLDPKQTKQFVSVSYCLAQMAQVETSAKVMIKCELVPITLNLLPDTPVAAMENMWTVLVALSQQPMFFGTYFRFLPRAFLAARFSHFLFPTHLPTDNTPLRKLGFRKGFDTRNVQGSILRRGLQSDRIDCTNCIQSLS